MGELRQYPPIVTLAALYGAGGSIIGPRIAERLGVEFLDRGIAKAVAAETGLSEKSIATVGDAPRSPFGRVAASLGKLSTVTGEGAGALERLDLRESEVQGHIAKFIAHIRHTGGVVLGHGGMVVLQSVPWALHVNLGGPRDARVRRAMSVDRIDEKIARKRQKSEDAARRDYLRGVYGVDIDDVSLYDVVLDSTALSSNVCVDIVVTAANARRVDPRPVPGPGTHDAI